MEANNEQRLPLKKRHYHISTAAATYSQADSTVAAVDCNKKILETTGTQEKEKQQSLSSVNVASKNQGKPSSEKPPVGKDKGNCNGGSSTSASGTSNSEVKLKPIVDLPRNSIDEAIEACITRYTATSPPVEISSTPPVHTVIATPKKRHRMETAAAAAANLVGKSPCGSMNKSEGGSVVNNKLSSVVVATPPPSKRTISRSASVNSGTVVSVLCDSSNSTESPRTSQTGDSSVNSGSLEVNMDTAVSTSSNKLTSSCKTSSPSSKSASQVSKAASPPNKVSTSASNKTSSPSKISVVNNKASPAKQCSSVTRVTSSVPSKESSSSSATKTTSPQVPVTKATASKVVPSSTVAPVSASTVTTTTTATTTAVTTITTTTTTAAVSTVSTVGEIVLSNRLSSPMHHNLRLKRASAPGTRDDSLSKRGVGKKKKLIRDVRVHVTKLSPTDFLLKKHVGAGKQRVRRRKAINRTGFPIKKRKKKQLCMNNSLVPTPLSAPVINVDVKKTVVVDSISKTATPDNGVKEILNNSETKWRPGLVKKEKNSRISEARLRDRDEKGKVEVKVNEELEKKPVETVNREQRQTVNGKRDAIRLEDIPLKERREMTEAKLADEKANSKDDCMKLVGKEVTCSETKELQASSKLKAEIIRDRCKTTESASLPNLVSEAVSCTKTLDMAEKEAKMRRRKRDRERDSSRDDSGTPLSLSAKRLKKCREEDVDHDDR